mmetsp:Transcript_31133/g.47593  ORF Transcript_31133/g.47593 Transcript_31133/m.47593 type:complete len:104 (+) Transcript_31133:1148-1459(+)
MMWFLFCQLGIEHREKAFDQEQTYFIDSFSMNDLSDTDKVVTLTYFAFTSLSTVGLGDYYPNSNKERFVGAFVLLFGVAITSFIMENLIGMMIRIRDFNKGID